MDILEMLTSGLGGSGLLQQLGQKEDIGADKAEEIAELGIPAILEALKRNASTPEGASALSKALDDHGDDDVTDLSGFLTNVNKEDGSKMLDHILSGKKENVTSALAAKSGLDSSTVMSMLSMLAPLVIGAMAKKKKEDNLDTSGISDLTSMITGQLSKKTSGSGGGLMDVVGQLLDSDGDNSGGLLGNLGSLLGLFK